MRRAESRPPGPSKPPARISSCMNRLWTITPRAPLQQAPRHGHAFVIRAHFQLADALGKGARRGAAVVFALAHVSVPIAAPDRQVGDQVVQVGFVHHHDAGMAQGRLIDEIVIAVVADLV